MQFQSPIDIYSWMQSFIATPPTQFGVFGVERTKHLASLVGNPQHDYPVIHIAGTSGKWSTATCTSQILQAHGYKTWLHVSPHLLDRRERVQMDWKFMDDTVLLTAAKKLLPAIELCRTSQYGQPSYYESMIVFAYLCFSIAQVDVAVIEVGCGGLYDGSNIISRTDKISIITRQWYDHQDIVGETLEEISYNDAGIILPWSRVVALGQDEDECNDVVKKWIDEKWAIVSRILDSSLCSQWQDLYPWFYSQWHMFWNIRLQNGYTIFDYDDQRDIRLWLVWLFQAENAALAIAAAQLFCTDFDPEKTRVWLEQVRFVGRVDIRSINNREVVLDGAHNPQKMQALVDTLHVLYPNKKIVRYTAFKQGKDRQEMLIIMQTLSSNFILWSFAGAQDMSFQSIENSIIRDYLPTLLMQECSDPEVFLHAMEKYTWEDSIVVITGSLYWLSRVYSELA